MDKSENVDEFRGQRIDKAITADEDLADVRLPELRNAPPPAPRPLSALEQQEYELVAKTLASENGGIRRAAAKLGLTHQALLRRLEKWPELRPAANSSE